jgi:hypothetical protein
VRVDGEEPVTGRGGRAERVLDHLVAHGARGADALLHRASDGAGHDEALHVVRRPRTGDVDDPEELAGARLEQRRRAAVPGLPRLDEVLRGEDLDRAALGQRGPGPVRAGRLLPPVRPRAEVDGGEPLGDLRVPRDGEHPALRVEPGERMLGGGEPRPELVQDRLRQRERLVVLPAVLQIRRREEARAALQPRVHAEGVARAAPRPQDLGGEPLDLDAVGDEAVPRLVEEDPARLFFAGLAPPLRHAGLPGPVNAVCVVRFGDGPS